MSYTVYIVFIPKFLLTEALVFRVIKHAGQGGGLLEGQLVINDGEIADFIETEWIPAIFGHGGVRLESRVSSEVQCV